MIETAVTWGIIGFMLGILFVRFWDWVLYIPPVKKPAVKTTPPHPMFKSVKITSDGTHSKEELDNLIKKADELLQMSDFDDDFIGTYTTKTTTTYGPDSAKKSKKEIN